MECCTSIMRISGPRIRFPAGVFLPPAHDCAEHPLPACAIMLRRNKKNINRRYTSPRLTNSYVGGTPLLTLVTHPEPFYAAHTVETEPKTFSQDSQDAPTPLRPSPFPLSTPPRSGGHRRRSVRTDTGETLTPTSESPLQFQSPNTISPTTPILSPKLAHGKDVDEFPKSPQVRHWSGHEYSHQHTADSYSYQFDAPSPPGSGPSHYTSADVSGGVHAHVWPIYNTVSQTFDQKLSSRWNDDLDVMLIFVSLILGGGSQLFRD